MNVSQVAEPATAHCYAEIVGNCSFRVGLDASTVAVYLARAKRAFGRT
jgi:hypothetical protein